MDLRGALLKLAIPAWGILLLGLLASIYTGWGGSTLTPADVPVGQDMAVFGAFGLFIAGAGLVGTLYKRHKSARWTAAGREAGFQPTGGGSTPELTGTVDGRPVRARVETRRVNTGEEGGSRIAYTTLVEAELGTPAAEGAILGGDWGELDAEKGSITFEELVETPLPDLHVVSAGDLHVVATTDAIARAVAGGPVQDAVRSLEGPNLLYAGDASRVIVPYAEAQNEALEESIFGYRIDSLVGAIPADAGWVTVETKRLIQDAEELQRLGRAAAAAADVFESS